MLVALLASLLVGASLVSAQGYSTNNANSTLPLRGGPELVYAGQYGVPPLNASSPQPYPLLFNSSEIAVFAQQQVDAIIASTSFEGNCSKCIAAVEVVKMLALTQPTSVPPLLVYLCQKYQYADNTTCALRYQSTVLGAYLTQIVARMSVSTDDIQLACALELGGFCPTPKAVAINETAWFAKPKPANATVAPPPSGKLIRVIHISDTHWDSRYEVGAEGNCTEYSMCCRSDSVNSLSPNKPTVPAARYGDYGCDVPADLILSMFNYMQPWIANSSFAIFTGDIASHDKAWQLSRAYLKYEELNTLLTFKAQFGGIPLYPTLGNHDSFPSDQVTISFGIGTDN